MNESTKKIWPVAMVLLVPLSVTSGVHAGEAWWLCDFTIVFSKRPVNKHVEKKNYRHDIKSSASSKVWARFYQKGEAGA